MIDKNSEKETITNNNVKEINENDESLFSNFLENSKPEIVAISVTPKKFIKITLGLVLIALILLFALLYKETISNELILIFFIVVTVLVIITIVFVPKFSIESLNDKLEDKFNVEKEKLKLEDDIRKTIAQISGGIIILGGLILTYNTYKIQVRQTQLQVDQQNINLQGQITDRFTKAVEQVGNNEIPIRIGGLYALRRIAKDSKDDAKTVIEFITSFIVFRAKKINENQKTDNTSPKDIKAEFISNDVNKSPKNLENSSNNKNIDSVTVKSNNLEFKKDAELDIKIALKIFGEINNEQLKGSIDLREIKLRNLNLSGVDLSGADLSGIDLSGADLSNSVLNHTKLEKANLTSVNFTEASLNYVNLEYAKLENAIFYKTQLREAILRNTEANRTNFNEANLHKAIFNNALIINASFFMTKLEGVDFINSDLTYSNFSNSVITMETNFKYANLQFVKNFPYEKLNDNNSNTETIK